jgi:hypothetical protein
MIKTKIYSKIMSIFFVCIVLSWPIAATAQTPPVTYSSTDFGDVVVGTTKSIIVTITYAGESKLYFDYLMPDNLCGFTALGTKTVLTPTLPSTDITVEWTPSEPGTCTADLQILNIRAVVAQITVKGNAITEVAKKELPNVSGLLNSFEEWVENKEIEGKGWGWGKSADRHLNAFRKMLVKASMLMDQGYAKKASHQLRATLKLMRFLIRGSAVGELRQEINEVLASLKKHATGAIEFAEQETPEVDLLIESFDEWLAGGDIEGKGYGKYARGNLETFRNMLVKANDLVERGHSKRAYVQLMEARKMSGHLIRGDAVDDLKELISEVLNSLRT